MGVVGVGLGIGGVSYNHAFVVDGVQTKVRAKENSLAQARPNKYR